MPDSSWDVTESVGATAPLVAMWRMEETASPNPLIHDPYAEYLVQWAIGYGWKPPFTDELLAELNAIDPSTLQRLQAAKDYASVRTRFFDDFIRDACADGIDQIVILAAGLDARAWRLAWPQYTMVFEIDQPKVLAFKAEVLQRYEAEPAANYVPVGIDLRHDWSSALLNSGLNRSRRTFWLVEGLLAYLSPADQDELFERINALSRRGDWIGVEAPGSAFHSEESLSRRAADMAHARAAAERLGTDVFDVPKLMVPGDHADVADWLARNDWDAVGFDSVDLMAHYGRSVAEGAEEAIAGSVLIQARRH